MLWLILVWSMVYLLVSEPLQATNNIHVDPINGNDQECLKNGSNVSCKSLEYALGGMKNATRIQLPSGLVNLSQFNNTRLCLSNITIAGAGISNTTIQCISTRAGLYFVNIANLTIANLTISNCGMLQNSTTWNYSSPFQYPSAVTIYNSDEITIQSVSFKLNNGIGLSIINTGGSVIICGSVFDSNRITNGDFPGGGGLYIEFPFCLPNEACYSVSSDSSLNGSNYVIASCSFTNNSAKKVPHISSKSAFPYAEQTFGHGGGMSVFLRGYAAHNTISIIDSKFIDNVAVYGGGLFVGINHFASSNKIFINNSQFSNNYCIDNYNPESPGGGGAQILYNFYNSIVLPKYNNITFFKTYFKSNNAYWGGGIDYLLGKEEHALGTNILYFFNCSWYDNSAKFGAAIGLYRPLSTGAAQAVVLENCTFASNKVYYYLQTDQFELQGAGTVYTNSITIHFKGFVEFNRNIGSALVLFTSYVLVTNGCTVAFTNNKGWRGGALSLLASSWIKVEENTVVVFEGNSADEVGGAIYVELISEHKVVSQWNCFFQFTNPSIPPDNWTTKVQFQRNFGFLGGHAIYVTSLHSCVWNKNSINSDKNIRKAFHWKSFEFDGEVGTHGFSREGEIATPANNLTTYQSSIKVSPGEKYPLPFEHLDDEGHNATVIFFMQSDNTKIGSVDNQHTYGDVMQVYGAPNTHFNVTVTSLAPIPYVITLNVTFDNCPPGYVVYNKDKYDNSTSCKCANEGSVRIPGISECNDTLYRAYITRYNWGGIHKPSGKFVTADCPQGYCTFTKLKYRSLLPSKRSDLDSFQCHKQHRTGYICGECMSGYSISGQSNCVKCTHGVWKGLLLFLAYECIPTIVFVSVILVLNVNITSGYWHSLIFYFQTVEILNLYALQSTKEFPKGFEILINIHTYTFGIWNLQYYSPDVCYFSVIKNVFGLYALQYVSVLIAFVSVIVLVMIKNLPCTTVFRCYCQRCNQQNVEHNEEVGPGNRVRNLCNGIIRICRQWFSADSKLIHGIATVLVLSYTKIALLSMKFLIPGQIYASHNDVVEIRAHHVGTIKYFHGEHIYYVITAMFLLLLSAMIPLYLILKSIGWCNKFDVALYFCFGRDKFEQFLQEFYGSFKDDRRFYGGVFFVYRLALYITFAFTPSLMIQYCVQQCLLGFFLFFHSILQPYSDEMFAFANKLDAVIFMNLTIINALSVYNFYSVIDIQSPSQGALVIQLLLVYLPLLYIPFRVIWYCRGRQEANPTEEEEPLMDPVAQREQLENEHRYEQENFDAYVHVEIPPEIGSPPAVNSTHSSYHRPQVDRFQNDS